MVVENGDMVDNSDNGTTKSDTSADTNERKEVVDKEVKEATKEQVAVVSEVQEVKKEKDTTSTLTTTEAVSVATVTAAANSNNTHNPNANDTPTATSSTGGGTSSSNNNSADGNSLQLPTFVTSTFASASTTTTTTTTTTVASSATTTTSSALTTPSSTLSHSNFENSGSSNSGSSSSNKGGQQPPLKGKLGHRKVVDGEVTYKKTPSSDLMHGIQLGIRHSVGSITPKQQRDLLMVDFEETEVVDFPSEGGTYTPAHSSSSFRFKCYAPRAFRHFRENFGIKAEDFMLSLCNEPLRELSNPGASGSIFYVSQDDHFIIKTVQKREAHFLRKLLPGYYMNLTQNKKTLLPKFFGLYCYQSALGFNIRFVVMNNLLPSIFKYHERYDLKGSTHSRMASPKELMKSDPTFKDLDFMQKHPDGIYLPPASYESLNRAIQRDCLVLRSFKIMDYSLLVGVHMFDAEETTRVINSQHEAINASNAGNDAALSKEEKNASLRRAVLAKKLSEVAQANGTAAKRLPRQSSYIADVSQALDLDPELESYAGGIIAFTDKKERCLIYLGIIDILQQYQLKKKLEHTWKALIYDGDTVSVTNPGFYAARFQDFMAAKVFKPMKMEMLKELMPAAAHLQEEEELSNSNSNSASNGRVSEEKERPILIRNPFKRQTTNASADAEPSSPTRNSLNNILSSSPSRGKLTNRQLSQNDRSSKARNSGDFGGRSRTASGTSLTLPLPLPLPLTTTTAAAAAAASSSSSSSSSANPPSPGPNTAGTHALLDEELNTSI